MIIFFALSGGVEPPTLWLTATRSDQLSYKSYKLYLCVCVCWRLWASIPLLLACKASALPFELNPLQYSSENF